MNRLEYLVCNSLMFTDRVDWILRMLEAARHLSSILVSWQERKRKLTCLEENGELRIYCHHMVAFFFSLLLYNKGCVLLK